MLVDAAQKEIIRKVIAGVSAVAVIAGLIVIGKSLFSSGGSSGQACAAGSACEVQALLGQALQDADSYYGERSPHTYVGFTVKAADATDPSILWTAAKQPAVGQVSIRRSSAARVLLVSQTDAGGFFCIENDQKTGTSSKGKVDTTSFAACTGGW